MLTALTLSGTGPVTGFPVPGCPCATCASAGRRGLPPRGPARLRLPGGWWLDAAGAVHEPSASTAHRLAPGERLERDHLVVVALTGADAPALLMRAPGAAGLLWAPQAGRLPDATIDHLAALLAGNASAGADADLDAALLGPAAEADPAAPTRAAASLMGVGWSLARLRAAGAVGDRTRCLVIGLGHRQGNPDRLAACLRQWQAQAPEDGAHLRETQPAAAIPFAGGRTLVLGGASSGKSAVAEELLAAFPDVLYVATGPAADRDDAGGDADADDGEWARRVRGHRERRPGWWGTAETQEVAALLGDTDGPILLDAVGTWLAAVLDRAGAWDDRTGWREELAARTDELLRAWRARRAPLVAVSDEVGWSVVPRTAAGRLFRDELGRLNARLADESEHVHVIVAGRLL
jgi:adenosylcobinamide kinase/adenosylcobinamide-phosphate guanylyltransferase